MKRLNILWIFVVTFSVVLTSCYKEGPKISFKTKKDRLANEWIVTDYQIDGQTSDTSKNSFYSGDSIALVLNIARNNFYGMNMQYTNAYSEANGNKKINLKLNFTNAYYINLMGNLTKNNILYKYISNGGKWSFMDKFRRVDFSANDMGDLAITEQQKNFEGKVLMLKNDKLKIEFTIDDKPHTVTFEPLNPEIVK